MNPVELENKLGALKQYALDNYEVGGHWVAETYSDDDYNEVLAGRSLKAAKEFLKRNWEFCVEQAQECRWQWQ